MQKTFPGNIGEGISSDANVNIKKKTISINVPLITDSLAWEFNVLFLMGFLYNNI
jgi:hypothetical protein